MKILLDENIPTKASATTKINMSRFSKGVYVVEVKNKNQTQRAKVIKE